MPCWENKVSPPKHKTLQRAPLLPPKDDDTLEGHKLLKEPNWNENPREAQELKKEGPSSCQRIRKKKERNKEERKEEQEERLKKQKRKEREKIKKKGRNKKKEGKKNITQIGMLLQPVMVDTTLSFTSLTLLLVSLG
jgi:hypothetical protein